MSDNGVDDLTAALDPSIFDYNNDLHLTEPTLDETELASNDYCSAPASPVSRKAKSRKRVVDTQCPSSSAAATNSAPTVDLPSLEDMENLLRMQSPLQQKWCSKTVIPGFGNIPVCQTMKRTNFGYWDNDDIPPALKSPGLFTDIFDVVGRLREHILFLKTLPPPLFLFFKKKFFVGIS